jgi:Xaa-Pro aminopeptidase
VYPHQTERLTGALERMGLDALVATTAANVAYLTGFRRVAPPVTRDPSSFAIFTRQGTALVAPVIDAAAVADADADHVVGHGRFGYARPSRPDDLGRKIDDFVSHALPAAEDALAAALEALGGRRNRVGLDEGGLSAPAWRRVAERLGTGEVVPAAGALAAARAAKAPWEIECLDRALVIAEQGANAVIQALKPGMTEGEAVALYAEAVTRRGAEPRAALVLFGDRAAFPVVAPSDRPLRRGDLVRLDLGCVVKGYHAALGRTAVMGEPSAPQQRVYDALHQGLEAALGVIRPGAAAGRVHEAAVTAVRAGGLAEYEVDQAGHGLGLDAAEVPWLEPASPTTLEMGMVLLVEASYYEPGWGGVHLKDSVLVTSTSGHVMNRAARGLVVLD